MRYKIFIYPLLSFILLFSILSPFAFAQQNNINQFDKAIDLLKNEGITDKEIDKLGQGAFEIASLLRDNVIDKQYLKNAVNSMINYKHEPVNVTPKALPPTTFEENISDVNDISTLTSTCPIYSGTGAYWKVESITGSDSIKGYVEIPNSANFKDASSNDVPHLYLGLKNTSSNSVVDAGIYYYEDANKFYGFTNDAQNSYLSFKLSRDILPDDLVYQQLRANNDSYVLTIWDPSDWTVIGNVEKYVPSSWDMDYGNPYLSARYVTAIAQFVGDDFTTGSYMLGVHWYSVYLSSSGYSYSFDSNQADCIGYNPNDSTVVNWQIVDPYYDTYISIDYR